MSESATPEVIIVSCADGGECEVGDIGPGGGIVFYVDESAATGGRYLEAAPSGWNTGSDPSRSWSGNINTSVRTQDGIGFGAANTANIIAQNSTADRVVTKAFAYRGGGFAD